MRDFVQYINHQFYDFIFKYDLNDNNILRKVTHSISVANCCFEMACKMKLNQKDRVLAYLAGILHDIGRFEQWKLYQTYDDRKSVDHGDFSAKLCDCFDLSMLSSDEIEDVKLAIMHHTKPSNNLKGRAKTIYSIVANADAYSNVITCANGEHRVNFSDEGYTPEILDGFCNLVDLHIYSPKTKLDRILMLTASLYYVKIPFLRKKILEYNYIETIQENFNQYLNEPDKKTYQEALDRFKINYIKTIEK